MPQKKMLNGAAKQHNNIKIYFLYFAKMHIFGKNSNLLVRYAKHSRCHRHRELKFSHMCYSTNWHVFDGAAKNLQTKTFSRTTLLPRLRGLCHSGNCSHPLPI